MAASRNDADEVTSRQRQVSVEGRKVNYVDMGEGEPTVLLLHGIGASHRIWQAAVPDLANVRRVVAIDLPGFGASDSLPRRFGAVEAAEHIARFCDALDLAEVDVVGHSMGGMLGMQLVASQPARVRRLALISATLTSIMKFYYHPLAGFIMQPGICARFVNQMVVASLPIPQKVIDAVVRSPRLRQVACRDFLADAASVDGQLLQDVLVSSGSGRTISAALMGFWFDFIGSAAAVAGREAATLLVVGARDNFVGAADIPVFAHMIGRYDLVLVPNAGHWPMVEQPRAVTCALIKWMKDVT